VSPTRTHPDYTPSILPTAHVRVQTEGDIKRFERSFKRSQAGALQPVASPEAAASATATNDDDDDNPDNDNVYVRVLGDEGEALILDLLLY
jgi:hypothetical protein